MKIFFSLLSVTAFSTIVSAQVYYPQSNTTSAGSSLQSVSVLAVKDSSGTQRISSKYMSFNPSSAGYVGDFVFKVSSTQIQSMAFEANYRGDKGRTKLWDFQLYNN